jgi:hypothetical protein
MGIIEQIIWHVALSYQLFSSCPSIMDWWNWSLLYKQNYWLFQIMCRVLILVMPSSVSFMWCKNWCQNQSKGGLQFLVKPYCEIRMPAI